MDRFVIGRKIRARRRNTAAGQEIERYTLFPMIWRLIATPIPFARSLMPKLNEKKNAKQLRKSLIFVTLKRGKSVVLYLIVESRLEVNKMLALALHPLHLFCIGTLTMFLEIANN